MSEKPYDSPESVKLFNDNFSTAPAQEWAEKARGLCAASRRHLSGVYMDSVGCPNCNRIAIALSDAARTGREEGTSETIGEIVDYASALRDVDNRKRLLCSACSSGDHSRHGEDLVCDNDNRFNSDCRCSVRALRGKEPK